jgi:hypothetical protein
MRDIYVIQKQQESSSSSGVWILWKHPFSVDITRISPWMASGDGVWMNDVML